MAAFRTLVLSLVVALVAASCGNEPDEPSEPGEPIACDNHECAPEQVCHNCPGGHYCSDEGTCVASPPCTRDAECEQLWAFDPCRKFPFCDQRRAVCSFYWAEADDDRDGYRSPVCLGDDCNDGDASVHPDAGFDRCGQDDDCDGVVDNDPHSCFYAGFVCDEGTCSCAAANQCADGCFDLRFDPSHCGDCSTSCPANARCNDGVCEEYASGGFCDTWLARHHECGLVSDGYINCFEWGDSIEECETDCVKSAGCDDFASGAVSECREACGSVWGVCRDGRGTYDTGELCDGVANCADGSDELGCQTITVCNLSLSDYWYRLGARFFCDGYPDVDCYDADPPACAAYLY